MKGKIHIGTSGWHYPHWKKLFYPDDLGKDKWLRFYAEKLRCVEINNTFYKLPDPDTFSHWSEQTPDEFIFSVKAWRVITHRKKLKDCADAVNTFIENVTTLGDKLGPVLFQLPPRWHCNPQRLDEFLNSLPGHRRYAFEFRDPGWHNDEIYSLLMEHNAAFCIFEFGDIQSPPVCTADFMYIRLHGPNGPYAGSYPVRKLRNWAEKITAWQRQGKDVFIFFDNDEAAYAVKNALLIDKLIKDLGV
jgi:uncharacterized protein YecE (DUF72 family)